VTRRLLSPGARIKSLRKQARLSQRELADKMGLSRRLLRLKERGEVPFFCSEFSRAYCIILQVKHRLDDERYYSKYGMLDQRQLRAKVLDP